MKKLLLLLILCFFSTQGLTESNDVDKNEIIGRCEHESLLPKITKFKIYMVHHKTTSQDGCLIVKENTKNPTKSNQRSVKITVHPDFCSWDDGWNDCTNDRSRVEFFDAEGVGSNLGVVYNFSIYIPKEVDIYQTDHSIKRKKILFS